MSFDQETFNSIYNDLIFNNNEEIGSATTADDLIRLGWLLGQSSIALNHPTDATCAIHEENLKKYQKFTLDKQSKSSSKSEVYCGSFTLNAGDFHQHLRLPCLNESFDCNMERISKEDIDALFKTDSETGQSQTNKRSFSDLQPANEHSEKKFVFRQSNFGSISRDSTSSSSRTSTGLLQTKNNDNDGLFDSFHSNRNSSNAIERREFQKPIFVSNDMNEQRDRHANLHNPVLRNIQQRNDQNVLPSSNGQRDVANDRTMNSNGSNTTRDKYSFITAREELQRQNLMKNGQNPNPPSATPLFAYGKSTKTLGTRRSVRSNFVPPITPVYSSTSAEPMDTCTSDSDVDPRLKNIEPKMIELIQNEIMHQSSTVDWDDIAGLEYAKRTIQEAVVYPLLRPDIFTGLRGPPRGILLFGPPVTGKTLIGRCIASRSRSTFFSISASSLTSKWIGEGEKMVRALFAVAAVNQPAVIFIDEIDSLLSQRSDTEHESSRRLKTEFLVQLDGARTTEEERILIVGATNRPQELDEAARRRLTKRLYIPLPELDARIHILTLLLKKERNQISTEEVQEIGRLTDGFSGADMKTLCHEALMGPIRSIRLEDMASIDVNDVRLVNFLDFTNALKRVRASVSQNDLVQYEKWDSTYGLGAGK